MLRICRLANSKNSIHVLFRQERRQPMAKLVLEFSDEEKMRIEAILMDDDAEEALRFLKEVVKPKMREKGSRALDVSKATGVMT